MGKANSSILNWAIKHPKKLLLIDASGAALSAITLGLILPILQEWIGMPIQVLYILSVIPIIYFVYDLIVYYRVNQNIPLRLKIIALLNLAYCGLSLILTYLHWSSLTGLGKMYFLTECLIIILIAALEWKTATRLLIEELNTLK